MFKTHPRTLILTLVLFLFATVIPALADSYSNEEILETAKTLGRKQGMPPDKMAEMVQSLKNILSEQWFIKASKDMPPVAVFTYMAGEGGLVVKFMNGEGLISFKDGRQAAPIYIKSWSAGMQAGGSALYGAGVVMGMSNEADFGGDYTGGFTKAIAGDEATPNGNLLSKNDPVTGFSDHLIYMAASARGFYAGVGGAKTTITPGW